MTIAKTTICLWYDREARQAAEFYASVFPDSKVSSVHKAPGDHPNGKMGDELTVDFTVCGIPCMGLNGGPAFTHSEAFSFQIATDDQAETDRYWNAPRRRAPGFPRVRPTGIENRGAETIFLHGAL